MTRAAAPAVYEEISVPFSRQGPVDNPVGGHLPRPLPGVRPNPPCRSATWDPAIAVPAGLYNDAIKLWVCWTKLQNPVIGIEVRSARQENVRNGVGRWDSRSRSRRIGGPFGRHHRCVRSGTVAGQYQGILWVDACFSFRYRFCALSPFLYSPFCLACPAFTPRATTTTAARIRSSRPPTRRRRRRRPSERPTRKRKQRRRRKRKPTGIR